MRKLNFTEVVLGTDFVHDFLGSRRVQKEAPTHPEKKEATSRTIESPWDVVVEAALRAHRFPPAPEAAYLHCVNDGRSEL